MKSRTLIVAGLAAFVWQAPALAQESVDDRLSGLERRIKYLEQRVAAQDEMIVEKDRQIAELTGGREDAWFDAVEIGGTIELEAAYASHGAGDDPYEGDPSTTAELATVELGIAARIHDWVGAEIIVKNDDDDDIAVDETFLTIAPPEGAWALQTGRYVVPFGVYETNMISDPVTLDLGETGRDAVMLAAESGGLYGSVFAFNGDLDRGGDDTIDGFGVALGYAMEIEGGAIDANLSWINDLGESDGFDIDEDDAGADNVPGWAASVVLGWGDVTLIGEYLTALDGFEVDEIEFGGAGAEPSAWTVEAAYGFDLGGREATAAVGYQGTSEAGAGGNPDSPLDLPERRALVGLSVEMAEGVGLSAEWKRDEDYGEAEGGTGKNADTVTVQLAAEF